jgi:phenylalanyl-tRNA synthetase beta chain
MPTIKYDRKELKKLIGKRMNDEQLTNLIQLAKPNFEGMDGDKIVIEHTADRPDLFSIEGLARDISYYAGIRKGLTKFSIGKPKVEINISRVGSRPYVSAAIFRKVKMDGFFEGMIELQEILSTSIGRKRSKVAIGVHDLDKIKGKIYYSPVSRNEIFDPLGGTGKMKLSEVLEKTEKGREYGDIIKDAKLWPAFSDSKGVFSFPPILNSQRTAVTDKTKNLFVEATGTDRDVVRQVMSILACSWSERFPIEGVKLRHEKKSEITPDLSESVVEINADFVNRMLGLSLSAKEISSLLARMGYDCFGPSEKMQVIVPAYRTDILHPVDIVEDVAIAYGYNNFKSELPSIHTWGSHLEVERISGKASMALIGFGFQEILNSVLSNPRDQVEKMEVPSEQVQIANPPSLEFTCLRSSLLPGIMKFLSSNKHNEYPQNVFEIGDVVILDKQEETGARNERRIAAAVCHSSANFSEIMAVFDGMMKSLARGYTMEECDSPMYVPGRGVDIYCGGMYRGSLGEIHPKVIQNWDIGMPIATFELCLENI